jgi:isoleucyl-tRNA synthetase
MAEQQHDYQATVNLPKTTFPMRAQLPEREPEILAFWESIDLYHAVQARRQGGKRFILHDGPPFSNGDIHLGHALNKLLKDFVVKFRTLQGYDAPFQPGWDTHGLPTEILAVRTFRIDRAAIDPLTLRRRCAEMAKKYIDLQRKQFRALGVRGDWAHPYITMQRAYEAAVLEAFARMVDAGLIYRGVKPVYWCTTCETALAEAEVEYREHEAPSIYVAFPVVRLDAAVYAKEDRAKMSAAIWTTTPWTLPANVAVAVHPDTRYALVTDLQDREGFTYIVAEELVPYFGRAVKMSRPHVCDTVAGRELEGALLQHPFMERQVPVVLADYVTLEAGTGLVHIAPGHGKDDFLTGLSYGLPTIQPIGPSGIFGPEGGPFAGKPIYEAQEEILRRMDRDGTLLAFDTILHQYPHCWRCHEPSIFRATPQWFLNVEPLIPAAMEAAATVQWIPAWGRERLEGMLRDRPDWCISRQRAWGIPIPTVFCTNCGSALLSAVVARQTAEIVRREGADAWFRYPVEEFVPEGTACPACGETGFVKETDIFDVWFDSGCSHLAVLDEQQDWPADLYLEGHDQFRGWFQVSLLTALAAGKAHPPYRAVLAHGFVLDQTGQKQSKSLGNIIDPQQVIQRHGADILRLWVASTDFRADIAMSEDSFTQVIEVYRRMRNTARFLLANLYDFAPDECIAYVHLQEIDRWMLHRLAVRMGRITQAYERYEFHRVYHDLNEFLATELSAFYLDVLKDRLYLSLPDSLARRSAQTVLYYLAETLVRWLAPILSFTAEEIWRRLPAAERAASVQLSDWPEPDPAWHDAELGARWERVLAIREAVHGAVDTARTRGEISQPAAVKITLFAAGETRELLEFLLNTLASLFKVALAEVKPLAEAPAEALRARHPDLAIAVSPAPGAICVRCRWARELGTDGEYPDLCRACADQVRDFTSGESAQAA